MNLFKTSRILLMLSAVGLALLVVMTLLTQKQIDDYRASESRLIELKLKMDDFSVGSDHLMLNQVSADVWKAFQTKAETLKAALRRFDDEASYVERASHHIDQITGTLNNYYGYADPTSPNTAFPYVSLEAQLVMNQVANHGIALDTAMDYLISNKQHSVESYSHNVLVMFTLTSILFAILSLVAFQLINRRLITPISSLSQTIRSITSRSEPDARAVITGHDEVSQLAAAFNHMLDSHDENQSRIKLQNSQLLEQSNLLEISAEIAAMGGWRYELKTNQFIASKMVRQIHGLCGDDDALQAIMGLYRGYEYQMLELLLSRCIHEGESFDQVFQLDQNGQTRWVRCIGQPFYEDNTITQIRGIFQDVSERRKLELELERSQRIESVGKLTGGVAHDFNNLLTVISGNAELLMDELEHDKDKALLTTILQASAKGADLTRSLLAFARKQPLKPRVVNIEDTISELEPILARAVHKSVSLSILCDSPDCRAEIDVTQFESALLNLVVNANDAMDEDGEIIIETAIHEFDEKAAKQHDIQPGRYLRLAVSDNGCGIAPDHLERVFEPFYTTKGINKGTGLGLSSVYGFVKQSHGHMSIYSEQGKGTTVKIYLPEARVSLAVANDTGPRTELPHHALAVATILVVEDDISLNHYVVTLLEKSGYTVLAASNGQEALEILKQRDDISLLFTDVIMPGGMNGQQLAEQATRLRPQLKVLFTSGYTENAIIHHGRLATGIDLLQKPYKSQELQARLAQALG